MSEIPTQEVPNPLPVGLRVLAIDNDLTVLENVKRMSNGCHYQVITYSNALLALDHVRKSKGCIDLILIDVHMPNMDGYEFLKEIRKEIDVPVIVMSIDDSTSTRMEAIKHGACDYWKKPFHEDQFRNMWMHVANARKACNKYKLEIQSGRLEDDNEKKRGNNDSEATTGVVSEPNARPKKKARVIWTDELHNKFLNAFRQLEEIGTAVPKRILELMNVPDLTREKVASHLQKFRHQVQKNKSNEVTRQQKNGEPLPKTAQATRKPGRLECQAFAATGRVACETLTTTCLRPEMPKEEQWPNHPGHGVNQDVTSYGHPPPNIGNAQIRIPQPMIMNVDEVSGYGVWSPSANTMRQLSIQENHVLTMDTLHLQQQQQQQQQQRQESLIMHPPSVNLQPSCMLQVSQDSPIFHGYTTPAPAPAPAPAPVFHAANTFVPYASTSSDSLYQQPLLNFGYDDNQMYIPRASWGHEIKQSASDEDHRAYIRPPKQVTTTLMKQPRNLHL